MPANINIGKTYMNDYYTRISIKRALFCFTILSVQRNPSFSEANCDETAFSDSLRRSRRENRIQKRAQ